MLLCIYIGHFIDYNLSIYIYVIIYIIICTYILIYIYIFYNIIHNIYIYIFKYSLQKEKVFFVALLGLGGKLTRLLLLQTFSFSKCV